MKSQNCVVDPFEMLKIVMTFVKEDSNDVNKDLLKVWKELQGEEAEFDSEGEDKILNELILLYEHRQL